MDNIEINQKSTYEISLIAICKTVRDVKKEILEYLDVKSYAKFIMTFDTELRKFKLYEVSRRDYGTLDISDLALSDNEILHMDIFGIDHEVSKLMEYKRSLSDTIRKLAIDIQIDLDEFNRTPKFILEIEFWSYHGKLNDRMNMNALQEKYKKMGFSEFTVSRFIEDLRYNHNYEVKKSEHDHDVYFLELKQQGNN